MWLRVAACLSTVAFVWGLPAGAATLEPPHVEEVTFEGDTFVVEGNTLGHVGVDDELTLVDPETDESVPHEHDLSCETENRCGGEKKPGCVQQQCTLKVTLTDPKPGQKVRLEFYNAEKTVRLPAAANPPPGFESESGITIQFEEARLEEAAAFMTATSDRTYRVDSEIADEKLTLVVDEPVSLEEAIERFEKKVAELGFEMTEGDDATLIEPGD